MAVSVCKGFRNVINDKDFWSKYTILVILSFCNGLLSFALLAKNYIWVLPALILSLLATIIALGYDLKYIQKLIANENSPMPEWSGIGEIFLTGLRYLGAIFLFSMAVGIIILIPVFLVAILAMIEKTLIVLMVIPLVLMCILELYVCLCAQGFIYVFLDSQEDILSLFNIKKIFSYFSINYFTALFIGCFFALLNSILGTCATIQMKYALLYIIPLMIAPVLRMGINNYVAQAYRANRDGEKGSLLKMFAYIGLSILAVIGLIGVSILGKTFQ